MDAKICRTIDDIEISLTEDEWSLMTDQKLNKLLGRDEPPKPKVAPAPKKKPAK